MIEGALKRTRQMAIMFESKENIRKLINEFSRKFFDMAKAENFDVRTIEFEAIVPNSDQRKIVLTLQKANYLDSPIKDIPPHKSSASYMLVRQIQSFYASFLAGNEWLEGLIDQCPGFCDCIFSVAAYLMECGGTVADLRNHHITVGDNAAGDLCFFITFDFK
jgi:hypothetical protein